MVHEIDDFCILTLFRAVLTILLNFWAFPGIWEVYNVWNTIRKVGLADKLSGLPTSYDEYFRRYWIFVFLPYILTPPKLRYLQTPCTGGLPHLDEAIFGIFLIVITLHRLLDCAGSSCYFFSICDPPLLMVLLGRKFILVLIWKTAFSNCLSLNPASP